jgi:hypothetical protein
LLAAGTSKDYFTGLEYQVLWLKAVYQKIFAVAEFQISYSKEYSVDTLRRLFDYFIVQKYFLRVASRNMCIFNKGCNEIFV